MITLLRTIFLFVFLGLTSVNAYVLINVSQMERVKENDSYKNDLQKVLMTAEKYCKMPYVSVMDKIHIPASGTKHDYMSLARYYWPNPKTSDGLPYIAIDGKVNPEIAEYDRNVLAKFCKRIKVLSLAFFFSNNERYAKYALEQLKVWFINEDSKMNPNMTYAQTAPGTNDGYGKPQGIIDSYSFVALIDYILLLKSYKEFSDNDFQIIRTWFRNLLKWLEESPQGIAASQMKNNAAVMYATQLLAYKAFATPTEIDQGNVKETLDFLISIQFDNEGKQSRELKRANSFHYSQFNLSHIVDYIIIAKSLNIDALNNETTRLKFYKGVDFLAGYLDKKQTMWKFAQKDNWHDAQMSLCESLYRIYARYDNNQDVYLELYKKFYQNDQNNFFSLYN
jgi:hypothetical protein